MGAVFLENPNAYAELSTPVEMKTLPFPERMGPIQSIATKWLVVSSADVLDRKLSVGLLLAGWSVGGCAAGPMATLVPCPVHWLPQSPADLSWPSHLVSPVVYRVLL